MKKHFSERISIKARSKSYHKTLTLICFCFLAIAAAKGQQPDSQKIKDVQRAIFIYNFAQQIIIPKTDLLKEYRIGVLGSTQTISSLRKLSEKRTIKNKEVKIVHFKNAGNVKNIELLYVNKDDGFDIDNILNSIKGKGILLVTEGYNYHTSMINIINVGDSFEYEINESILAKENFTYVSSLRRHAVSNSERWRDLYRTSEKKLQETEREKKEQQLVIANKEQEVQLQKEKINYQEKELYTIAKEVDSQKRSIKKLYSESEIVHKKYEEKVAIEKVLEDKIKQQVDFIEFQDDKIKNSTIEIEKQRQFLEFQNTEIAKNELILKNKISEIKTHKKINWLLILLIASILTGSVWIYRNYLVKKRLNKELEQKNLAIKNQSIALESKNKELQQFAYIASHDLQEPLNTISGLITMLKEDYGDSFDEDGDEILKYIEEGSMRMKNLIKALLRYSKLGSAKDHAKVDCNVLIDELRQDLKNALDRTGAVIQANDLPVVVGSSVELRLLFQNLVSNAIKFTKDNIIPTVEITSELMQNPNLEKNYWQFTITDNGIGIADEHKERIFAIFQRLHSNDEFQGTGIGLAHCKKIVETHGGKIWLNSKLGKGTSFYFTIPV